MDGSVVFVVDHDAQSARVVNGILESRGIHTQIWNSAGEFLAEYDSKAHACLILDVMLPDMGDLEVQKTLRLRKSPLPIIMTGAGSIVSTAVAAVRNGAVDFLEKPLQAELLVKRVHSALRISAERRQAQEHHETVTTRLARLSSREREVLDGLVNAMNTKQIAALLNVSPKTIDNHRASILKKFDVGSTLELVRMVLADGERKVAAR